MKLCNAFILLIIFFLFEASGQDYFFRQYANEEGLHHSFIYSINQDSDGFIWLGTGEGLYRFNGFDFEYFTTENGLADNFVTEIFRDQSGKLWIGHQSGSVSVLSGDDFIVLNESSEAQGSVTDIIEDDQENIWVTVQNQGLVNINKDLVQTPISFSIDHELLSQIASLGNDYFLIGSQGNIYLCKYERASGSVVILNRLEGYPGSRVVEIFPESPGNYIVISQEDGFYRFQFDNMSANYEFSVMDDNADGVLDNLQGGIIDGKGTLWLNSMGNGLIQYRGGSGKDFTRAGIVSTVNGLVSDNVRSVFEDVEGNLWFGMYGEGLLRYVDNNLRFYSYHQETESNRAYTITGDKDGLLAVIGNRLFRINQGGDTVLNSYPLPDKHSGDRVNAAYLADDGRLWLGFEQSGLYVSSPSGFRFRAVSISNDDLANSVNHITGQDGYIWIGTKKGICRISRESGNTKWFTTDDGLPHNNIQQLYIDSKGRVLVATLCSEIHYISDKGEIGRLDKSRIGPFNSVVSISEGNDGIVWAGTQGNGIWKIMEGDNANYNRTSGLISDFCYSLTHTEEGVIVVGHRGGVSQIDPETNRIKTFSRLEGIKSSAEFYPNAIYTDNFGDIWFGTSEGIIKYTSALSPGGTASPKLQISTMYVDGEQVDYELVVDYIGINFSNPEMVSYQTKLEGYNKNWSTLSSGRRVVYDRVGHGNYTFKIRAFNENDISSEISSAFELRIKKPIHLTIWFYAVVFIMLGFLVYIIIKLRERKLRTEQVRLLKNLDEKTKDIIIKEEIIKERKKVEKVLIEAKTKAELSDKLKTSFLKNMSHEIRTPMNAVIGFSDLLKRTAEVDTKQMEYINVINTNAENLLTLIDDILDVSQLESNQLNVKKGACKVNVMIDDLKAKYLEVLEVGKKTGIELITIMPGDGDMEILTDPVRLKQILVKLLDNAVKYTESGRITFGYELDRENITFFVDDTGIGLSEDTAGIIFDLFRKVEDDKLKLYGGTGLGLTLARYLVHLLEGEIDVISKENVGSRFNFVLPFIPNNERSDPPKKLAPAGGFHELWKGKKVLVVEDTDSNYLLLEKLLTPTGIAIERAADGEVALHKYFEKGSFDFIIMDIKLPGMDGYETTMKIREKDKRVPIISYTAYALEGDRDKSIEAGCNAYFSKPTSSLSMLNTISGLINNPDN